jgi:hypothetical protein
MTQALKNTAHYIDGYLMKNPEKEALISEDDGPDR